MKRINTIAFIAMLTMGISRASAADNTTNGNSEKTNYIPKITGMVNLRYSYDEGKKDEHGFDVRRVRLGVKGSLHKKLDYVFQAEYETNVRVLDAYLRWKIVPEFNVQAGQFKVHFSQETLGGPANWLVTESPTAVNKLNSYNDLTGLRTNGRDIGMMFYGGLVHKELFDVLRYRVGVFNGNGTNIKDNNRKKDVATMLWISPVRQLSFTGSYYYGTYGAKGDTHAHNRASAGAEWKDNKLTVRSEYLWGQTSGVHSHGAYVQAAYMIHQMFQPVLSYDYFKQDSKADAYQHNLQVGLNVSPIDYLRIQAAYTHTLYNGKRHNNMAELQAILYY